MYFFFVYTQLKVKTVLFQKIQFSIRTLFSSIQPIDRKLSGTTTPGPESNGNKRILYIPQSSSITGASPSDCLVSYPGHLYLLGQASLEEFYFYEEMQCLNSTFPANWVKKIV